MNIYFPREKDLSGITDMCVAAHQDDIEIMAYGPISECYDSESRAFAGVVVTDGAGSPRAGEFANYTDEQMMQARLLEQQEAADIGRYRAAIQLGFSSAEVKDPSLKAPADKIYDLLTQIKPKYLYTHNPADKHPTHVAVALRTIDAVRRLPADSRPEKFIALEVWRSLDWLPDSDKIILNTEKYPEIAARLLTVHRSQVAGGKRYDHAAIGRRLANATFFESHDTDECVSMNFGLDLMPMITNDIPVREYIDSYISKFKNEVDETLKRLSL